MSHDKSPKTVSSTKLLSRPSIHSFREDTDSMSNCSPVEITQKPVKLREIKQIMKNTCDDEELQEISDESDDQFVEKNTSDNDSLSERESLSFTKECSIPQDSRIVHNKLKLSITHQPKSTVPTNVIIFLPIAIVCMSAVLFALKTTDTSPSDEPTNLKSISEHFLTQDESLWIDFEAGVEDVVTLNRPSTFIFLYTDEAEKTAKALLPLLSQFAACKITDCSKQPINVSDSELNSAQVVDDYGYFVDKYKDKLNENGVMVVNHLENVKGISAQAFHPFCDEFTPLVHKSLVIFTMKVDKLHGKNKMKFIESYLKQKWTDVKIDILNALITRITSMVEEINP